MIIRQITPEDYQIVVEWWKKHNATVCPDFVLLPAFGYMVASYDTKQDLAAGWLFIANGTDGGIGLIEFTTTNPEAEPKKRLAAVKELYSYLEKVACSKGCGSLMSFVAENSGEQHIMDKMGYKDTAGKPHLIYAKALCPQHCY